MKRTPSSLLVTLAFFSLGAVLISHHELWRDEVQSWLLARDSVSPVDLLSVQQYEGHPALWQLLLYLFTRAFSSPVAMQWFHLLIASATVYLFVRYSPFTALQKVLFSFGYFPFYEYAIISRSYGLSLFLLTVFCCLYPRRDRYFIPIAVTLVLLGHTHALGLILALVVFAALWLDRLIAPLGSPAKRCSLWSFSAGTVLFVLGALGAAMQIKPPADTGALVGWQWGLHYSPLLNTAKALVGAYLPVPSPTLNFWNHPLLTEERLFPLNAFSFLVVPGYVLFVFFGLRRSPVAGLVFLLGTSGLLLFFYTKYAGHTRHHGFLFVCLIVSAWIHRRDDLSPSLQRAEPRPRCWPKAFTGSLTLLLGVHVAAAAIASVQEYRHPFSSASAVADYLHRNGHDDSLLIGHWDQPAAAILGFSTQRQMYYPQSRRWGSYIIWNQDRLRMVSDDELINEARALPHRSGQHRLLVLNRSLEIRTVEEYGLVKLGTFSGAIVPDENFHLYDLDSTSGPGPRDESSATP